MKKFTLIELLIVVAIIGVLVSILMPSLSKARQKAILTVCMSNSKQLAMGMTLYTKNNNEWICPTYQGKDEKNKVWSNETIFPVYVDSQEIFKCPTDNVSPKSYGTNGGSDLALNDGLVNYGNSLKQISLVASDTYFFTEKRTALNTLERGWPDLIVHISWQPNHWPKSSAWHGGPISYTIIDGHVKVSRIPEKKKFTWYDD